MSQYVFSVDVAAAREPVFDLWVNVDRMPEWTEGLTRVADLTGQPGQAGTRYTVSFGRTAGSVETLAAERPRSVRWRVKAGRLTAEISAAFEAVEAGGARTQMTQTITTSGVLGWVWARVLATGSFRGSFRGELMRFAKICERDQIARERAGKLSGDR